MDRISKNNSLHLKMKIEWLEIIVEDELLYELLCEITHYNIQVNEHEIKFDEFDSRSIVKE